MHVVINHLRLRNPLTEATVEAAREGMRMVVDAGAVAARFVKVDETHLIPVPEVVGHELRREGEKGNAHEHRNVGEEISTMHTWWLTHRIPMIRNETA